MQIQNWHIPITEKGWQLLRAYRKMICQEGHKDEKKRLSQKRVCSIWVPIICVILAFFLGLLKGKQIDKVDKEVIILK